MTTQKFVIVGAGGFSREVISWAEHVCHQNAKSSVCGYLVDEQYPKLATQYELAWLGGVDDYTPKEDEECLIAVSDPGAKQQLVARLRARGAKFATLVHPTAVIAKTATIGIGTVVCPYALVSADVHIGDFVTINAMSSIGHDSTVGAYSTLSAHVDITGGAKVGESTFFGSGSRVLPKLRIGNNAKVGAGATVMRSVPEGGTVYTAPARKLR